MVYWLNAVDKHSLQAPFIYELYTSVIKKKSDDSEFKAIEELRSDLQHSTETIPVVDFGAGSKISNEHTRAIRDIASKGVTQKKYSELLHRLCQYLEARHIIELGTSLGINSLYLASCGDSQLTTFEGCPALCQFATETFNHFKKNNIQIVEGNIDDHLAAFIENSLPIDMAFIDANHQYSATTGYFEAMLPKVHDQSCLIFDDIHWSAEMEKAWNEIRSHYRITLSIDLYQMGIIFFNPDLQKQHYTLQF